MQRPTYVGMHVHSVCVYVCTHTCSVTCCKTCGNTHVGMYVGTYTLLYILTNPKMLQYTYTEISG